MNRIENSGHEPTNEKKYVSPIVAYLLALFVWFVLPWAISFLAPHYGWEAGRPSIWNVLGLILVFIGSIGLFWGIAAHAGKSAKGVEWEPDKSYLLTNGLYTLSRNPMYLAELILLFGWVLFYGSISLLITFAIVFILFIYYLVPQEERILEAHFGESYREYRNRVPRWLGKMRP